MVPVKLAVHPAAVPDPALKYQLVPDLSEQNPGNAALFYYRAFSPEWWSQALKENTREKVDKAAATPLKDLPKAGLNWLENFKALQEVDRGARCEHCDWALMDRFKSEGIAMLLPDLQGLREFGRYLAVRARLEMAEGHFDKSLYTLKTGFALAQHVNEGPTLIHALVSTALANMMLQQLEELIQQPGAPNLYWALTTLPQPFIKLRKAIQAEAMMVYYSWPLLRLVDTTPRSGPEMEKLRGEAQNFLSQNFPPDPSLNQTPARLGVLGLSIVAYPEARRALIAQGHKPEEVDALPVLQVVLIATKREYDRQRDAMFKWMYLPYPEARLGLKKAEAELSRHRQKAFLHGLPLAQLFLPAVSSASARTFHLDRRIAALRCLEALRLYAAAHGGQLPATLADIQEVPVPPDPLTGKCFEYKLAGNRATLHGPAPSGETPGSYNSITYEVTVKP
jgi:hypothetical protein